MGRLEEIPGTNIIRTETDEIRLGHTWHEVNILKELIRKERPEWFIEIGVHEGGLSYILLDLQHDLSYWIQYLGVELYCELIRPIIRNMYRTIPYAQLFCGDCFGMELYNKILSMRGLKKIIYCDGGNKAKELALFKSICDSNDIILTHDFYDETRIVKDVPVENISIEVTAKDIQHMEDDPTFERLDEELFKETRIIGWRKK